MRSFFTKLFSFIFLCFLSSISFAQSCGSGGGATVCLSATGTADAINLSWTVSGTIDSIQIYRDTDSNPTGRSRIASLSVGATTFSDTTAAVGTQYWYWVKFRTQNKLYNSGAASATRLNSCSATSITPYIAIDGVWTLTSEATVSPGTQVQFGPQPWGNWSWSSRSPTNRLISIARIDAFGRLAPASPRATLCLYGPIEAP